MKRDESFLLLLLFRIPTRTASPISGRQFHIGEFSPPLRGETKENLQQEEKSSAQRQKAKRGQKTKGVHGTVFAHTRLFN